MEINESDRATLEGFRKHIEDLGRLAEGLESVKDKLKLLKEQDVWLSEIVDQAVKKIISMKEIKEQEAGSTFDKVWRQVTKKKGGR